MDTIFTKIINREIPADIVYEDELVLAFLDIHPVRKGHTLIIPKKPAVNIFDIDSATFGHMAEVAQKIARAVCTATGAHGVNICMNNGDVADQDIFHAHMHVIPRFERNEAFRVIMHETYRDTEASTFAKKIKENI